MDGRVFSGFAKDHTQVSTGAHVWAGVFDSSNTLTTIINRSNLLSDATGHDVGEIIWFQNEISLDDRQKVEGYLAHKWGLTVHLPDNHPYKSVVPGAPVATASLTGTASEAENDSLTMAWSLVSGPAAVSFANSAALTTTASFSTPGTYTLRLTTNDSFSQVSDDVVITVNSVSSDHLASFAITGVPSQTTANTAITGITLTALDDMGETATGFTGTVTYGGTAGITGTSANFVNGVLSGVSITPTVAGTGLTFLVTGGTGQTGSVTFTVQSLFQVWAATKSSSRPI